MFSFELAYAGVFRIVNVPQENLHPLVMIECPRLLFPFAREIIATAVRDGGFPPFFFQAEDGIRVDLVTGVQTCGLPISRLRAADAGGVLLGGAAVALRAGRRR